MTELIPNEVRPINLSEALLDEANTGYGNISKVITQDLLLIIQARTKAVYGLSPLRVKDWLKMDYADYQAMVDLRKLIFPLTSSIGDEDLIIDAGLNRNDNFEPHLSILADRTKAAWYSSEAYRNLYPEGTSIYFPLSQVQTHDLSRDAYNGRLPLWFIDWMGVELSEYLFPDLPNVLHSIDWNLGLRQPRDNEIVAKIFGAWDTLCKPGVTAANFFEAGGDYERWLREVKKQGDLMVPQFDGSFKKITFDEYAENDMQYTLEGLELTQSALNIDPYEFLQEGIDKFTVK